MGFRKRRGETFSYDIDEQTLGLLGLNVAVDCRAGTVEINPGVGIRFNPIEELLESIMDDPAGPQIRGTTGIHLGYLMPQKRYTPWVFSHGTHPDDLAHRLAAAVAEYGIPFMTTHSTIESVFEDLAPPHGVAEFLAYKRPVAALLLGRLSEAGKELSNGLRRLGGRDDPAAERYREFARRFSQILADWAAPRDGGGDCDWWTGAGAAPLVPGGMGRRLGKAARFADDAGDSARGFRSTSAFRRAMGPAGEGMEWHHIVEQTSGNVNRFGPEAIYNTSNVIAVPAAVNRKIGAYYSSVQPAISTDMTVRQWLATQPFEVQSDFGLRQLERFGTSR